jgi:hypothetical protein
MPVAANVAGVYSASRRQNRILLKMLALNLRERLRAIGNWHGRPFVFVRQICTIVGQIKNQGEMGK